MNSFAVSLVGCLLAASAGSTLAQCARLEANKPLQLSDSPNLLPVPQTAVALVAYLPGGTGPTAVIARMPVTGGAPSVPVSLAFVSDVAQKMVAGKRGEYQLAFLDASNVSQGDRPFFLGATESEPAKQAVACGTAPPAAVANNDSGGGTPSRPTPASPAECQGVAARAGLVGLPYQSWLLFNSTGAICYAPFPLRQRDTLNFAIVWKRGETVRQGVTASVTNCKTPTPQPVIFSSGDLPDKLTKQSTTEARRDFEVQVIGLPVECASEAPKITVAIPQESGSDKTRDQVLNLFGRYTAVFHVGVLTTKQHDPDYGLRTLGGQTTIVNREAEKRGPEYVAMVVVQALPKSISSLWGQSYPGRDLLHDNDFADRVGLALSFGIKDPGNRFGLGLSFEIAKGVNVVGVYEWTKRTQLNGVAVGDTFAGAATDIPTRKEWQKGWSMGLTFDIDYITKVFGAAGK